MPPTASQAYLAADLFTTLPNDPNDAAAAALRSRAARVLSEALCAEGWTGATTSCSEYGKPPVSVDPEAQLAVMRMKAIRCMLADPLYADPVVGQRVREMMAEDA